MLRMLCRQLLVSLFRLPEKNQWKHNFIHRKSLHGRVHVLFRPGMCLVDSICSPRVLALHWFGQALCIGFRFNTENV